MSSQERTAQWLADRCDVTRQAVGQWLDGSTASVKADALLKAASALGVDPYWLWFGESEPRSVSEIRDIHGALGPAPVSEVLAEYALVPRLSINAGLGAGVEVVSEQITDQLAFKRSWLQHVGVPPNKAVCIRCVGDSMEPTISDGDLALIDTTPRQSDGLYALSRPSGSGEHDVTVKRLMWGVDRRLSIHSDNRDKYPDPEVLEPGFDLAQLRIVGRVVWAGGRVY